MVPVVSTLLSVSWTRCRLELSFADTCEHYLALVLFSSNSILAGKPTHITPFNACEQHHMSIDDPPGLCTNGRDSLLLHIIPLAAFPATQLAVSLQVLPVFELHCTVVYRERCGQMLDMW
jgi:hypothetical protein